MPNVLSPRDLVSRPDNMDETVPHSATVLDSPWVPKCPQLEHFWQTTVHLPEPEATIFGLTRLSAKMKPHKLKFYLF